MYGCVIHASTGDNVLEFKNEIESKTQEKKSNRIDEVQVGGFFYFYFLCVLLCSTNLCIV